MRTTLRNSITSHRKAVFVCLDALWAGWKFKVLYCTKARDCGKETEESENLQVLSHDAEVAEKLYERVHDCTANPHSIKMKNRKEKFKCVCISSTQNPKIHAMHFSGGGVKYF